MPDIHDHAPSVTRRRLTALLGAVAATGWTRGAAAQSNLPDCLKKGVAGSYRYASFDKGFEVEFNTSKAAATLGFFLSTTDRVYARFILNEINGLPSDAEPGEYIIQLKFDNGAVFQPVGTLKQTDAGEKYLPLPKMEFYEHEPIVEAARASNAVDIGVFYGREYGVYGVKQPLGGVSAAIDAAHQARLDLRQDAKEGRCMASGCFLTTACCDAVGLDDDCWELRTARRFRDGWLARQPGGAAEIEEYYRIAPEIVETLRAQPDAQARLNRLYAFHIAPTCALAALGLNTAAHRRYRRMVRALEAECAPLSRAANAS